MEKFIVEGGHAIAGEFTPAGNKNEALPVLAACLLTAEPVTLHNLPDISDIRDMLALLRGLGVETERLGDHSWRLRAATLSGDRPEPEIARRIRGSFLLASPLLARLGSAQLDMPGGDRIGLRRLDTHQLALEQLGARVTLNPDRAFRLELPKRGFRGRHIFLDEASVTATENALMAAARAKGTTVLENAASEPHVQGLCRLLVAMGARIAGIGTNRLEIEGVARLGGCEHSLLPDHTEVGSLIGLAAFTGGELLIREAGLEHLRMIRLMFDRLGVRTVEEGPHLRVPGDQELVIRMDLDDAIPKIDDGPWPAFPSDLTSIMTVVATRCRGTVLIFEKMFENRLFWVDRLIGMGARIVLCDLHRAVVVGPSRLTGATITTPDIRAGMALLIAALGAQGTSEIQNVQQIDRGYEAIDRRLNALGAHIRRETM
ncbi:MAG: UDP-N-acetylglucosamine 1-carboxyvinyltransferase [Candidatus Lambdaproteobacteria bacterium]|nr:UDP-N-acetylglucosamine 1-carboxyvinyltransferase [Candidatus Lambdaproteobacteria bacterium]